MDKVHVYMWLHTASIEYTAGNKTWRFPSPFHISTSSRLTLAEAFQKHHVAASSTALRSASEENEWGECVTVACLPKVTQHSSTAEWLKF